MSRARDTANQINRVNSSAADATALTVDSSERVLIGKTSAGYNVDGFEAHPNGETYVSRSGTPMAINRNSSDGTLLNFYKDGTGVGSIQSRAGSMTSLVLNPSGSDGAGFTGGSNAILPVSASALVDNTIDLGVGSYRYNDLFLGGGVYLGGTGSANKLSDFETGTWTPTLGGNAVYDIQSGDYIKVGGLVYASFAIRPTSLGTGSNNRVSGLPFSTADSVGLTIQYYDGAATNHYSISGGVTSNYLNIYLKTSSINSAYNSTNFFQSNSRLYASVIYRTTA